MVATFMDKGILFGFHRDVQPGVIDYSGFPTWEPEIGSVRPA